MAMVGEVLDFPILPVARRVPIMPITPTVVVIHVVTILIVDVTVGMFSSSECLGYSVCNDYGRRLPRQSTADVHWGLRIDSANVQVLKHNYTPRGLK